jgi:DNA-binding GntR family transcriptional regulator
MEVVGVSEGVLKHLRVEIITRAIAPGQKLNEFTLSSSLGISRAPLREAFRILEKEHLVVSIPRKGCCVTAMSISDCRDIYGVRTMMECFAIEMIESRQIRKLPDVEMALKKTARLTCPNGNDPYEKFEYLRSIADFHIKLVEAAGNRRLTQLFNAIFPSLARYQSLYTYIPGLMDESEKEHGHALAWIRKGNYSKAKDSLRRHINKFIPLIEDKVREIENP